jgi:dihydroorotate dehydrogenase (fumarate)
MSVDLRTRYLGIVLKNPVVVSACPLTANLDTLRRLEDAGAAAAVMPSLFEEQLLHDELEFFEYYEGPADSVAEAQSFFPELEGYDPRPDTYLRTIEAAKDAVEIPIIGSLNGVSRGGWTR